MSERVAKLNRSTKETKINIELNIDGNGSYSVVCENQFLKHMLETLARYSNFDIKMEATGDNDHHLIEDVGITLGKCFSKALTEESIERMSTKCVVMDDAMVITSIDIVDRGYADIDCPDPLYHHFFRSFANSCGMNLHIVVMRGFDNHHIVEASFKSLGKCLQEACKMRSSELSTKDKPKVK